MNKKLLLVEDEEYIRDLYKRQLDLAGLMTDAFGMGNEGLAAAEKNPYDLILLDIMLPDINGLQILQKIKQNPLSKNTPVVLLTNLGQDAVIKQGFELGADGYLVKAAYTPDQIVQEIKNIMAKPATPTQPGTSTPNPATAPVAGPAATPNQPIPVTPPPAPTSELPSMTPTPQPIQTEQPAASAIPTPPTSIPENTSQS
jgi:DNA-binding response OmpR family regulator